MTPKLTPEQSRVLRVFAGGGYPNGLRSQTLGRLVEAGLIRVTHYEAEERFRPARHGFTRTRWSRTRTQRTIAITDLGRQVAASLAAEKSS